MELLLRWRCKTCPADMQRCSLCGGKGYIERWVPYEAMYTLTSVPYLIMARRRSQSEG